MYIQLEDILSPFTKLESYHFIVDNFGKIHAGNYTPLDNKNCYECYSLIVDGRNQMEYGDGNFTLFIG